MSANATSDVSHSSRGQIGAVLAFTLGAVSTVVLTAVGASLGRAARPALVKVIKRGILASRSLRGTAERLAAGLSDTYALARQELETEEGDPRSAVGGHSHDPADSH